MRSTRTGLPIPALISEASTAPVSSAIEPTDRSTLPAMMTRVAPSEASSSIPAWPLISVRSAA